MCVHEKRKEELLRISQCMVAHTDTCGQTGVH